MKDKQAGFIGDMFGSIIVLGVLIFLIGGLFFRFILPYIWKHLKVFLAFLGS